MNLKAKGLAHVLHMSCSQGDEFEGVSFTRFPVTQGAAAELTVARLQMLMNPLWHMGNTLYGSRLGPNKSESLATCCIF